MSEARGQTGEGGSRDDAGKGMPAEPEEDLSAPAETAAPQEEELPAAPAAEEPAAPEAEQ